MSEVINIKELNERIERESVFVDTLRTEMGKVIVGQSHLVDTLLIGLLSNGHILLEGVPGLARRWPSRRWLRPSTPVSAGFSSRPTCAGRLARYADIQSEDRGVLGQKRTDFRELHSRRRDQPLARESAERAARGDAGTAGHSGRHDLPASRAVSGARYAEPARAGGHLPAARGAGRPFHAQGAYHLSQKAGGARYHASESGRRRAAEAQPG